MLKIERIGRNPLTLEKAAKKKLIVPYLDHVPTHVVALKTSLNKAFIEGRIYKVSIKDTQQPVYNWNTCWVEEDEQGMYNSYAFEFFRPATRDEIYVSPKSYNQIVRAIKDELYGEGKNINDALKEIKNG